MQITRRSDIVIHQNRQRQEFDPVHVQELADSISTIGLLNPPVLRQPFPEEDFPEGTLVLVAGETRLKAITLLCELGVRFKYNGRLLELGDIPYSLLSDLDVLAAEEAELDENLKRRDLTWVERCAAIERLHNLRIKQKGDAHTIADLTIELHGRADGAYRDGVKHSLQLAKHLDNPEIAKAKTSKEAYKILKQIDRRKTALGRAEEFKAEFVKTQHKLFNENCLDWMESAIADGQRFDVILTDPPYGMGASSFGDGAGKLTGINHHYNDSPEHWRELMTKWTRLSYQIAATEAHLYAFCDIEKFQELKDMLIAAGWYVFRTPLIYYKTDDGRVPLPDIGPRRQWEAICYAVKGKKKVNNIFPDVISASSDGNLGHGAQKPVACYQNLLQRSCLPGDKVLDTFCGTGTIFPAAQNLKCIATGIELDKASFGIAVSRLESMA